MIPLKVPTVHSVPHTDPLGHHALTCKYRGDVVSHRNRLRDVFLETCRRACIGARVEAGSGLGHDQRHTQPADVLVPVWMLSKPAAFDITVTSLLNSSTFTEASVTAGSAALAAEQRKHNANDEKCSELGWKCVPLAVESYGCWGTEARQHLARLASRLATRYNISKSQATSSLYGRLNSSSAVPPDVLSRHLLDSVLHNNPVGAFIPNRVIIIINNNNNEFLV